ncbi:MAG: hypothetical protein HW387_736 [Parachlamydiales bacterium]|nr:hypothetical protein [Parachlamydiales bacterium]
MITTTSSYAGPIGTTYNGQEIVLRREAAGTLNLRDYPIHVSKEQFEAIPCRDRVFSILTQTTRSPSEQAGVSGMRFPFIEEQINDVYEREIKRYHDAFDVAIKLDDRNVKLAMAYPAIPSLWPIEGGIHRIIDLIRRIRFYHHSVRIRGSANRYAWMIATGDAEMRRLDKMKAKIERRCFVLIENLKREFGLGFLNSEFANEIIQLEKIYKENFPGIPLQVSDSAHVITNVSNYIENIRTNYPQYAGRLA